MTHGEPRRRSFVSLLKFIWLNLWFWTAAPLASLLFIPCAALYVSLFLVAVRNRRKTLRLIRRTISWYGATILRCPWPLVRVKYVDYSPGETPPFVFVSNHRSSSDAFLMACLPFECIQVQNIWPSKIPFLGMVAKLAGYLNVRQMPFEKYIASGSKLLAEGCSIIAFPEGTRSGSANLGPFHGSAFRLAQHTGVKIVPLVICGNENIPPRGNAFLNPGVVTVSKLPAVTAERYEGMNPYKLKTLVRDMMWRHIESHPA